MASGAAATASELPDQSAASADGRPRRHVKLYQFNDKCACRRAAGGDDALRTELHAFSRGHPRWGVPPVWATGPADAGISRRLREEGWDVNRERVHRLWREEGLRVPAKRRKRQRLGHSAQPARRLRAERPNHV